MSYTGNQPKDLDSSEPAIGTAKVKELDDAIRQIKRALLNGSFSTATASGDYVIPDDTANVIYNGAGGHTLTLPEISDVAATVNGIPVERIIKIFNEGTTTGSGGAIDVEAHTGDTLARLTTLWQHESAILISDAITDEWKITIDRFNQLEEESRNYADGAASDAIANIGTNGTSTESTLTIAVTDGDIVYVEWSGTVNCNMTGQINTVTDWSVVPGFYLQLASNANGRVFSSASTSSNIRFPFAGINANGWRVTGGTYFVAEATGNIVITPSVGTIYAQSGSASIASHLWAYMFLKKE